METIFKIAITAFISLFMFGALSLIAPIILALLSKMIKKNSKSSESNNNYIYLIVLFLFNGFIMSIFFHRFDYFNSTTALIAPMVFVGVGMLKEKGVKSWIPFISYIIGWFSFYLILN